MIERVNTPERVAAAKSRIDALFATHAEWFLTLSNGHTQILSRHELDIWVANRRLILNSWTETGNRLWTLFAWEWTGEKLELHASRRMGAERPVIELVPRASASSITLTVKAARQARCEKLATLACSAEAGSKVERASLSPGARRGQPGRYARIILRQKNQLVAVTGSVASSRPSDADAFLSAALIWFSRAAQRSRPPYVGKLWLALENSLVKPVGQRVALLRQSLQDAIVVYEVDNALGEMTRVEIPTRADLWMRRLSRFPPTTEPETSAFGKLAVALAPDEIDIVHARHGETLRYRGLPFARVRRVMGTERVWFGVEGSRRRLLAAKTDKDWTNLLSELVEYRRPEARDHHHALYRNAGEAWLESLLRRDITCLDPGLIIAPLYAQFRISRGGVPGVRPIDLLALRQDGRLVVIELKVSEDREHVLQGADYWQRVEAHRRRGNIARAKLFGDRKISNQAPLVYLVAPTLRVHPSFNLLARLIAPDIEIYRFDINEDWRAGVRVMRRVKVS